MAPDGRTRFPLSVLGLCFAAALIEGFDIQAAGVAAPSLKADLSLTPAQLGFFFSAATFGLMFGAISGGRISDVAGRKASLLISLSLFAVASIVTGLADSFRVLVGMRFLTGVGLGGTLPTLIAIASEVVERRDRAKSVATIFAGLPLGGGLAGIFAMTGMHGTEGWRAVFMTGGIAPLVLVPLLALFLPPLRVDRIDRTVAQAASVAPLAGGKPSSPITAIFGPSIIATTILLWGASFLSLLILYLVLNWMPSLLIAGGLTPVQAGATQLAFNVAGAAGAAMVGPAMDGRRQFGTVCASYGALAIALLIMAQFHAQGSFVLVASILLGLSLLAVQSILYGLAPRCYPDWARGTGVGASVAAGRAGSVAGPLFASVLLAYGFSSGQLFAALGPIAVAAAICALLLVRRVIAREAIDRPVSL